MALPPQAMKYPQAMKPIDIQPSDIWSKSITVWTTLLLPDAQEQYRLHATRFSHENQAYKPPGPQQISNQTQHWSQPQKHLSNIAIRGVQAFASHTT